MDKVFYLFMFFVACVHCQVQTDAEIQGNTQVEVKDITIEEFGTRTEEFREVVSWHISRYCKGDEDNCWSADKQIRRHDIIIQNTQTSLANVNVMFYIQDRTDPSRAGLQNHQVREAFEKFGSEIEGEFGKSMEVVDPLEQGMEPWLIGVIAASCAVGVALIITIIVLGCRQCEERNKREVAEKLVEEELRKEYSLSNHEGVRGSVEVKVNPGYDSDSDRSDKPSTSRSAEDGKGSPPPDYNGRYDMDNAPAIPPKTAYEMTKI